MNILEGQLETREPKSGDQGDLERMRRSIEQLFEDSWVAEGLAQATLDWQGEAIVEPAGVAPPNTPLNFEGTIKLLVDGLAVVLA